MSTAEQKYQELVDKKEWNKLSNKKMILSLQSENKSLKKAVIDAKRKASRSTRPDKTRPDRKASGLKPWLLKKPTGKQKTMLTYQGEKWYWCPHHEKWQKHSPEDCRLNPKNKKPKDKSAESIFHKL